MYWWNKNYSVALKFKLVNNTRLDINFYCIQIIEYNYALMSHMYLCSHNNGISIVTKLKTFHSNCYYNYARIEKYD